MLLVTVICSDPDCAEEREIPVDQLDAIDGCACECSHGFVVVTVSELRETGRSGGSVISLPERQSPIRRAA
jgi:hypothetical protein